MSNSIPQPYDLTTHDGKTVDWLTHAALLECERRLGYTLTVVQGSYNQGGVAASAGTHDGGGAVDLLPWDWQNKVKVLREVGFAAWHRTAIPGVWGEHIHAILIGNAKLSPAAAQQVTDYRTGLDGLANRGPDDFGFRPSPIPVFQWPTPQGTVTQLVHLLLPLASLSNCRHEALIGGPDDLPGVRRIQKALNKRLGLALAVDGHFGPLTRAAYARWQKLLGYQGLGADGVPGQDSLTKLGTGRFRVTR